MNVTFLVTQYPTKENPVGGIFHKNQADALVRRGLEVQVIAPVPWVPPGVALLSQKWNSYASTPEECVSAGVRVSRPRYLHWPKADYWGWSHREIALASKALVTGHSDLVHAHFAYPCGLAAVGLARSLHVPVVLTLHGSDVNISPHINRLSRHRFETAVNKASCVLAVSQALAEKTLALSGRRPVVLPIGIDLKRYSQLPDSVSARRLLGLPLNKRVVLFVGNLIPSKGITELMAALAALKSENVLGCIIGDGPMRATVQESETSKFLGQLPNREVALYLAAADIFILPSYSEGMPTVLVEAGAAGLPIVATSVGGIPELLAEERGLVIPPRSSDAIVWGIRYILANWEEAIERASRLNRFVQHKYSVDSNADILVRLYERLLKTGPVPAGSTFDSGDFVRRLEDLSSQGNHTCGL
jgi:teichuronic acid biosynthesis glycosyltransferase TuaC